MCSRLIDVHNVTLWSCPIGKIPKIERVFVGNSPSSLSPSSLNTLSLSPSSISSSLSPSSVYSLLSPSSSLSPSSIFSSLSPTSVPSTLPTNIPSPSPISKTVYETTPSDSTPSSFNIFKNSSKIINVNNYTNINNYTCIQKCDCNYDIFHILHVLWILPLLFLFGVIIGRKLNTYRIQGMPAIQYFMRRRSNSWPRFDGIQLSNIQNITERSRSEPAVSHTQQTFDSIMV